MEFLGVNLDIKNLPEHKIKFFPLNFHRIMCIIETSGTDVPFRRLIQ